VVVFGKRDSQNRRLKVGLGEAASWDVGNPALIFVDVGEGGRT
jgi:hypothetical protein